MAGQKILIVGNPDPVHIGAHFDRAAKNLGLQPVLFDIRQAWHGSRWLVRFHWWFLGRRPPRMREYNRGLVEVCKTFSPRWLVCTGLVPVLRQTLDEISAQGIEAVNYLTDDPWNPAHRAPWIMKALPGYRKIFSVRRSNLEDLRRLGCADVGYLPFAYAPELHFPEIDPLRGENPLPGCDVAFVGGADRDRLPYIKALLQAGLKVGLYGGYWSRYRETRAHDYGMASPEKMRQAVGEAKINLCLVRKANRDGNAMRTFEIPAIGGCMLAEDTDEHRDIFGTEGERVLYFTTPEAMLDKARFLLAHEDERKKMARAAHLLITQGGHTYRDRLMTMLGEGR